MTEDYKPVVHTRIFVNKYIFIPVDFYLVNQSQIALGSILEFCELAKNLSDFKEKCWNPRSSYPSCSGFIADYDSAGSKLFRHLGRFVNAPHHLVVSRVYSEKYLECQINGCSYCKEFAYDVVRILVEVVN